MTAAEQTEEKRSFLEALSFFIHRNRKLLLFGVVVVLAALAALVIVLQIRKNKQETSLMRLEQVQTQLAEWIPAKEEAEKDGAAADVIAKADSLQADIVTGAEALVSEYQGLYAQIRASDILAAVAFRNKEYEKAATLWMDLADKHAENYLAPISLVNAAAAWEEAGNPDNATEVLTTVLTKFSATYPAIPRVLFSLGRLEESKGNYEAAKTHYDRLLDDYAGSSLTKLAHNRIIILQVQEKIPK